MERVKGLRRRHIVRQIGAIFDTRKLGYKSSLVAMKFPHDRIAKGARVVNQHPGVSHNYERNHPYNLWFTIAVPPNEGIEETVAAMAQRAQAESYRILPTLHFFKVGVNFDMVTELGNSDESVIGKPPGLSKGDEPLSDFEIEVIKELQEDLPLESEPFQGMAERLGITLQRLFQYAEDFADRGLMRRYSAVLHHRRAGFRANAMVVWRVPEERDEEVGRVMAASPHVSHCYQRPTYEDWPYSHFTMVHAKTQEQCEGITREISEQAGIDDYMMLYSTREYKKTRVRYFA